MTTLHDLIKSGKISLDTKVLGALPMTADGAIACDGATVFWARRLHDGTYQIHKASLIEGYEFIVDYVEHLNMYREPLNRSYCYSTREAALAARSKQ